MKKILYLFILFSLGATAQTTISRQVIGATGGYQTGTNITLSSTVGEAAVQTLFSTSKILTQGFQQPETTADSVVTYEVINESCRGAQNGSIFISNVLGCPGPYQLNIIAVGDSITVWEADKLSEGSYYVEITGNNCSYTAQITVGIDNDEDCLLKFYSGITPNNDGKNDVWVIENIEQFPENEVKIFNRWGEEVWYGKNYDNKEVVWEGNNKGGDLLSSSTYFYIADVDGTIYKGWVELTR